jgi:Collagen triple helix repeat (20 copies)
MDTDALADRLFAAVKDYCAREHARSVALLDEARALLERAAAAPPPRDGADGKQGVDGKDGAPGPAGERGEPGPAGAPGAPGEKGERGDAGPPGQDGAFVAGAKGERGEPGPAGRDGADGRDGAPGREGERGPRGEKGERGTDGRDALELDILELVDASRTYARGTFAKHAGGLLRAYRKTDPIGDKGLEAAGWQVVVNGLAACTCEALDERRVRLVLNHTDGAQAAYDVPVPAVIYRGIWTAREYERGDMVTRDGSVWHAERATRERPVEGALDWTLAVQRGRRGKDLREVH